MPSYDAGTVEARLTLDRTAFTRELAAARRQAKTLDGKDIKANLDLDRAKFETELASVKKQLQSLDRQTVEPKVQIDRSGLMTRRISLLKTALIGLAPAGVPILAGLTAASLGLAGALAGAAGGLGAFGLALGGNVIQAGEMSSEITKLNEKLEETEDLAKRRDIYDQLAQVWSKMDDSQREFVTTLQTTKTVWDQFLTATRPQTLGLATRALELIPDALSPLPSLINAITPVFEEWTSGIEDFVRGPGYAGFLNFAATEGPPALRNLGELVANLAVGVARLTQTFTPFGQDFLSVLVEGSETFALWARDLGSTGGFQSFMAYVAATGPLVVETLSAIIDAGTQLVQALAPLGGPTLQIIKAVAEGLAGISDVAPGLIQFALIAGTVARGIGAISDAQIAIGRRTDRFKAVFADAVGPMQKFKAGLGGALGLVGGPWGLALAAGTITLGYFAAKHAEAQQRIQDMTSALRESQGAINDNVRALVTQNLEQEGALKNAQKLGIGLGEVTDAALNQSGELDVLRTRLQQIVEEHSHVQTAGRGAVQVYDEQGRAAKDLLAALGGTTNEFGKAADAQRRQAAANRETITSTDGLKFATTAARDAYDKNRKAIEDNITALQGLIDKNKEARNQALGFQNAQIGLEQAFDDAAQALKDNGKTLDINTQKGRDNKSALLGIASAMNEVVDSEKFRAQSAPQQLKQLDDQRGRFIELATALGASKDAAKAMADELLKTPTEVKTEVEVETEQKKLDDFKAAADGIPAEKKTAAKFATDNANVAAYLGALGTIPPEKPTKAKFANDNPNVAAYQQALGGIPPSKLTAGVFSGNGGAIIQWKNDLSGIPDDTYSYGNFNSDVGAVRSYLGYLNSIDGKTVTAYATTVRRVETIYERKTGNLPQTGGVFDSQGKLTNSYAGGGVMPGYAPGIDSIPTTVSPGEGILRPEVVRALGASTIHAWNRAARRGEMNGDVSNLKVGVPAQPQGRGFVIEQYNATTVYQSSEDALMDSAQQLNLMFRDLG
jgi:hypothetical protein